MLGWLDMTKYRRFSRRQFIYLIGLLALASIVVLLALLDSRLSQHNIDTGRGSRLPNVPKSDIAAFDANPTPIVVAPTPVLNPVLGPSFLFGVGTELDHAINHRITKEAPIK